MQPSGFCIAPEPTVEVLSCVGSPERWAGLVNRGTVFTRVHARLVSIVAFEKRRIRAAVLPNRSGLVILTTDLCHCLSRALRINKPITHLLKEIAFVLFVLCPTHVEDIRRLLPSNNVLHERFATMKVKAAWPVFSVESVSTEYFDL